MYVKRGNMTAGVSGCKGHMVSNEWRLLRRNNYKYDDVNANEHCLRTRENFEILREKTTQRLAAMNVI